MRPPPGRPWLTEQASAEAMHAALRLHYLVLSTDEIMAKRFVAIRLGDGGSDNTVYDTRADAIKHQSLDQNRYLYLCLPLERMTVEACDAMLWYARRLYDNGYRPATSHEGAGVIMPIKVEDMGRDALLSPDKAPRERW